MRLVGLCVMYLTFFFFQSEPAGVLVWTELACDRTGCIPARSPAVLRKGCFAVFETEEFSVVFLYLRVGCWVQEGPGSMSSLKQNSAQTSRVDALLGVFFFVLLDPPAPTTPFKNRSTPSFR